MKTNLKEELKNWLPAFEEIIEQKWDEQYENDRDMANDWAESTPFDKIACEKAKNISSNELMKLVFETIYLADENGSCFDIQDIESENGSESIQMLSGSQMKGKGSGKFLTAFKVTHMSHLQAHISL